MHTGWIEVAAIPAVLLGFYALNSKHWFSDHARLAWAWIKSWARLAPFTTVLWLLVAVHAWMLIGLPPRLRNAVLAVHSTNLAQLRRDPVTVLFASAMWTDASELIFLTGMSLLILGPLERWLGTKRTVAAFLAGHIGATLLIALWLASALTAHSQQDQLLSHTIDVGVSYGTYCCAALLAYRLRLPYRLLAWGLFGGWLFYHAATVDFDATVDFTALGHLLAFSIGLLLYPLTRSKMARNRRDTPWIMVRPINVIAVTPPAAVPTNETRPVPR